MYSSHTQWIAAPRVAPPGQMLFAVGDVHGHADELTALHSVLRSEIDREKSFHHSVVHLGDYIDRGPDSKKVFEILCAGMGSTADEVFLVGNHDQFLIEVIDLDPSLDRAFFNNWYDNGGATTMQSLRYAPYKSRRTCCGSSRLPETQNAHGAKSWAVKTASWNGAIQSMLASQRQQFRLEGPEAITDEMPIARQTCFRSRTSYFQGHERRVEGAHPLLVDRSNKNIT